MSDFLKYRRSADIPQTDAEVELNKLRAEIERLKKALDQAISLASIRLEYRTEHGDPEGDAQIYVCCDTCGTPYLSALADYLELKDVSE